MRRFGLRARITAGFAAGALVVSAAMAILSYQITRTTLLNGRERTAERAAYLDAGVISARLAGDAPEYDEALQSLNTGSSRRALIRSGDRWYGRNADSLPDYIPSGLQRLVATGVPAVQRIHVDSGPALAIGIPLSDGNSFYVVDSLRELDQTLQVLALVLGLVAAGTAAFGAGLGWYATRRVVRPLTVVADAAKDIAAGNFGARLYAAADPDLEALTTSFNHMVGRLAQRLERDRRFAADVSHELRSPLQTLAAAATVLANRRDSLDPRTAAAARLVSDEVDRFQRLVTDLLELARGDEEKPDRAPVDMADLVHSVCSTRVNGRDLLQIEPGADVVWPVDRLRMGQVLVNLLDNAERHGGGATAVRIGQTPAGRFLEVDDEGPGVRPEDREAIFDRFVRSRNANARGDQGGTGLGLALVAQHVASHGGRVFVTDRPGGGARFRIELPDPIG